MAKLKSRGRTEIFRVSKEKETPEDKLTSWEKKEIALMSDGNFLIREVVLFRTSFDEPPQRHDYGWKVKAKIKPGLTAEAALKLYLEAGYALVSSSPHYLVRQENQIADVSKVPVRTESKASKERAAKAKRAAQSPRIQSSHTSSSHTSNYSYKELKGDGPGLYITNQYAGTRLFSQHHRVAEIGPFHDYEAAEEAAWTRLREFVDMKFNYLLPVEIIESESRDDAEMDKGYVWWIDGTQKGPPVDPRQEKLFQ